MQPDEKIQAHLVSVWRESKKFFSIGGREGMLLLTDKHLMFVHKTKAKMTWWKAITQRQVINFVKSKNTMILHDGYDEEELIGDLEDDRDVELGFDDIKDISFEEKSWGSVLQLEYEKDEKQEKLRQHSKLPIRQASGIQVVMIRPTQGNESCRQRWPQ